MFIIAWIILAIAAGAVAEAKGRSGLGYLFLGLLLPVIGIIVAACMPSRMYVDANGVRRQVLTEDEFDRMQQKKARQMALATPEGKAKAERAAKQETFIALFLAACVGITIAVGVIMTQH